MSEYDRARSAALTISSRMPENHPCKLGNGNCCEQTDIGLVQGDSLLIVSAAVI